MLYDYLVSHYKKGEPIFIEDIHIEGINRPNFCQQLKTLTDNGKLKRYEKGIYYLPKETLLKVASGPSSETIAKYKYISRNGITSGFYSGGTFANEIGISLQVPSKKEIVSNNLAAIVREVAIGKQKFIVRKTNIPINKDNVHTLQLLELLKNLDAYIDGNFDDAKSKIHEYILINHIAKNDIDRYIRNFPDKTFRFYYEMRIEDVLA